MFLWGRFSELIPRPSASIASVQEQDVYAALGEEGFKRLIEAFYHQVPSDAVLGPLYPAEDLEGAEERLRDFLIYRFGGPPRYLENRGHPRLRMRHAPFPVGEEARTHWLQLMHRALEITHVPEEPKQLLWAYFEATAQAMKNRV
jgi:hemoglobin